MFRGIILATLLLCISPAVTGGVLEHTAVVAFKDLRKQPHSDEWEYSGFIVLRGGGYYYTMFPHTDQKPDFVMFDIGSHMLSGDILVAIYHNHTCHASKYFHDYFSFPDLISAKMHNVPTFMLDNCTGLVHEFDWKIDTVHGSGGDKKVKLPNGQTRILHLPSGRIVGDISLISPNLDAKPLKNL